MRAKFGKFAIDACESTVYYAVLFLWSLVWTLEVKNDKGLPLYPEYEYQNGETCE